MNNFIIPAMSNHKKEEEKNRISEREMEVLLLIVDGYTTPQIAEMLFITDSTVHNHRVSIFQKLDVHNIAGMIKAARKNGFIR